MCPFLRVDLFDCIWNVPVFSVVLCLGFIVPLLLSLIEWAIRPIGINSKEEYLAKITGLFFVSLYLGALFNTYVLRPYGEALSFSFLPSLIVACMGVRLLFPDCAKDMADFLVIYLALGHAIGRIGCFFAGCCFGVPYNGPFAMVFSVGSPAFQKHGNIPLFPSQILESIFLLVLCILLRYLKKNRLLVYAVLYSAFRLFADFARGDNRGLFVKICGERLYFSQLVAIVVIFLAMSRIVLKYKRNEG